MHLRKNRKKNPSSITAAKLKKGEAVHAQKKHTCNKMG
jgi:hypothetical protein